MIKLGYSEKEIKKVAHKIFQEVWKPSSVVFLEGDLGAGKSTLVRSVLEVAYEKVHSSFSSKGSPTFPLVLEYQVGEQKIYHMDLYRIESEQEWVDRGLEGYFEDPSSLYFIEWGSKFPALSEWIARQVQFSWEIKFSGEANLQDTFRDFSLRQLQAQS